MGSNVQSFYDGMALIGSLVVMVLVIVLTYFASRWYANRMSRTAAGRYVKIVDRISVGPGCALMVVQAGESFYLLGVSDKNIRLLCELPEMQIADAASPQAPFRQVFQGFLNKTPMRSNSEDNGGASEEKDL